MMYRIANDRLSGVPFEASPHFGGRIEPTMIVLHDTSDRLDPLDSVRWFRNPKSKASAHVVVGRGGEIIQLVPLHLAAWHAGKSTWQGRANCNGYSIGIEIDNPGKLTRKGDKAYAWFGDGWPISDLVEIETPEHGKGWWMPYTLVQIEAVDGLIRALTVAYPSIREVVGHYHIAPKRKIDPGPQFPMAQMQAILDGRYGLSGEAIRATQSRLAELGFWPGAIDGVAGEKTTGAVAMFQRANGLQVNGKLDGPTLVAIKSNAAKGAVTGARELVPVSEIPSTTLQSSALVQRSAEVGVAGVLTKAIAEQPSSTPQSLVDGLSQLDGVAGHVETAKSLGDRMGGLLHWIMTPDGLLTVGTIAVLAMVWTGAWRVHAARVRDFVTGKNAGGA